MERTEHEPCSKHHSDGRHRCNTSFRSGCAGKPDDCEVINAKGTFETESQGSVKPAPSADSAITLPDFESQPDVPCTPGLKKRKRRRPRKGNRAHDHTNYTTIGSSPAPASIRRSNRKQSRFNPTADCQYSDRTGTPQEDYPLLYTILQLQNRNKHP
jgi:hypothetical protein